MPRRRKKIEEPVSALPEKFEVFEESMAKTSSADARPIGGMVETKWNGKRMWQCPRCNATSFEEGPSRVHTCKRVKFADEEPAAE